MKFAVVKKIAAVVVLSLVTILGLASAWAEGNKKTVYRKTQEVNFDEQGIDGVVHSPDGAYLVQKRGIKFAPLYKVERNMESGILDSINYLK